jgi:hypothetical protein
MLSRNTVTMLMLHFVTREDFSHSSYQTGSYENEKGTRRNVTIRETPPEENNSVVDIIDDAQNMDSFLYTKAQGLFSHQLLNGENKYVDRQLPPVEVPLLSKGAGTTNDIIQNMISWVHSKGGFFNPKLEIRKLFPDKESSPLGVFAREHFQSKEDLMHIPPECYIDVLEQSEDPNQFFNVEDQNAADQRNLCMLNHKLMEEMKLGNASYYSPYTAYLRTQAPGQLPVRWSKAGRDLLRSVSRPGSEMVDWMDLNFINTGCIREDSFEEHMIEMTVQRSFDTALIPLW